MLFQKILITLILLITSVISVPLYKINLQDKKEFEISSDNKDYNEDDENEMIQVTDLMNMEFHTMDESRYKPLHSFVESYNKRGSPNKVQFTNMLVRVEPNVWENVDVQNNDKPFVAGFKEDLDKIINENSRDQMFRMKRKDKLHNYNNYTTVSKKVFPRQVEDTESGEEAYDYGKFKKEYEEQIEQDLNANKVVNYTAEEKTEESPKEVLKALIDLKNCSGTPEEYNIKAMDCLMHNYEREKDKPVVKKTLQKAGLIIKVWFLIYVCFAIPCWCQYGWCCCCFRFKACFPRKRILLAKQYYGLNPPGTFTQGKKKKKQAQEIITYEATEFEEEAYEQLENAIRNL